MSVAHRPSGRRELRDARIVADAAAASSGNRRRRPCSWSARAKVTRPSLVRSHNVNARAEIAQGSICPRTRRATRSSATCRPASFLRLLMTPITPSTIRPPIATRAARRSRTATRLDRFSSSTRLAPRSALPPPPTRPRRPRRPSPRLASRRSPECAVSSRSSPSPSSCCPPERLASLCISLYSNAFPTRARERGGPDGGGRERRDGAIDDNAPHEISLALAEPCAYSARRAGGRQRRRLTSKSSAAPQHRDAVGRGGWRAAMAHDDSGDSASDSGGPSPGPSTVKTTTGAFAVRVHPRRWPLYLPSR